MDVVVIVVVDADVVVIVKVQYTSIALTDIANVHTNANEFESLNILKADLLSIVSRSPMNNAHAVHTAYTHS